MNLWILESVLPVDFRSFRVKGHVGSTVVNEFTFLGTIVYVTWSTASFLGWDLLFFQKIISLEFQIENSFVENCENFIGDILWTILSKIDFLVKFLNEGKTYPLT